jgi:hypothetical protein
LNDLVDLRGRGIRRGGGEREPGHEKQNYGE